MDWEENRLLNMKKLHTDAGIIDIFGVDLYFAVMEKIMVYDGGRLIVSFLDGTNIECLN
jgi:hypothetical protein